MKILVTNDDSIESEGIRSIVKSLTAIGSVFVVAPQKPQSAQSHAITMHKPLRVEKFPLNAGEEISYRVSGTPADCVLLALDVLIKDFDIVVSGINKGPNLGNNTLYSGTVAAAREGAMNDKLSFAISVNEFEKPDFEYAAKAGKSIIETFAKILNGKSACININFPNSKEEIKGIKFAKLSFGRYKKRVTIGKDPFGREFYWIGGMLDDPMVDETDSKLIEEGYVTVTPLIIDQTDYNLLKQIENTKIEI